MREAFQIQKLSSPRKRGCFALDCAAVALNLVFPAQAGVFPQFSTVEHGAIGLPRASGGVSGWHRQPLPAKASSPRKRGCFYLGATPDELIEVFPAQAGVFPLGGAFSAPLGCLPRASGGVSANCDSGCRQKRSSPRKRGCFRGTNERAIEDNVFPAQAGVFLRH